MTLDHLKKRGLTVPADRRQHVDDRLEDAGRPADMHAAFRTQSVEIGRSWPIWPTVSRVTVGSMDDMTAFCAALGRPSGLEAAASRRGPGRGA